MQGVRGCLCVCYLTCRTGQLIAGSIYYLFFLFVHACVSECAKITVSHPCFTERRDVCHYQSKLHACLVAFVNSALMGTRWPLADLETCQTCLWSRVSSRGAKLGQASGRKMTQVSKNSFILLPVESSFYFTLTSSHLNAKGTGMKKRGSRLQDLCEI